MNNEQPKETLLSEGIIKAIKQGQVNMRPKWHYVLKISLLIIGTILLALVTLFVASFIIFSLRQNGAWFTPSFGPSGWLALLKSLPWILITIAIIFIVLLGILVKKYSFAYGRPLLYSALGIIFLAAFGGFLIALTPLHAGLSQQFNKGPLPLGKMMYEKFGTPEIDNIVRGEIIKIEQTKLLLRSDQEETINIIITPQTKLPRRPLQLTDEIMALGEKQADNFQALGIELLSGHPGRGPMFPRHFNNSINQMK